MGKGDGCGKEGGGRRGERLSMSERERERERMTMSDRERKCLRPRAKMLKSHGEMYISHMQGTGHNSGSRPPFETESSLLERIFHAAFTSNSFKP